MKYLFLFITLLSFKSFSQDKEYIKFNHEGYEFPILVRGNLASGKLLLYVQGGPGETAIDFARSDYPRWKKSLENEVAIAYYDQRGLNQKIKNIDSAKINYDQYSEDMLAITDHLKEKYKSAIYIFGHSAGGNMVLHTLQFFPEKSYFLSGAIIANTPITSDFSVERYQYHRPLYLKNLASEKIANNENPDFWKKELEWINKIDSITNREDAYRWNRTVEKAFEPAKRGITPGMVMKVIFSRPYSPFSYFSRKDNEYVEDLLWAERKGMSTFEQLNQIENKVLLLTGRYDDVGPPEEMKEAHLLIPNSELTILPNASHESYLDQPEKFNSAILNFVKD